MKITLLKKIQQEILKEQLPQIDVKQKVMEKIQQNSRKPNSLLPRNRYAIIALLVMTIFLLGFGTIQVYKLLNGRGEVIFEYTKLKDPFPEQINSIVSMETEKLKEGEAVEVLMINDDEDAAISRIGQKPYFFDDVEKLEKHIKDNFTVPVMLPGNFVFESGKVYHNLKSTIKPKTIQEARSKDHSIIIQPAEVLPTISSLFLFYTSGNQTIRMDIAYWGQDKLLSSSFDQEEIEKLTIQGKEVLLITYDGNKNIKWIDEEQNLRYELFTDTMDMTKDEMITIVENLISE